MGGASLADSIGVSPLATDVAAQQTPSMLARIGRHLFISQLS